MNAFRYTLAAVTLSALLAGCGEAQNALSVASSSVTPTVAHVSHGTSWMLPEAKGEDLLYVANYFAAVNVYTFRTLALVGTLSVYYPGGECTDKSGNVFITSVLGSNIVEYAHGGTTPIATVLDSPYYPNDCFIDAASGNLCVANLDGGIGGSPGNLSIYKHAQGAPKRYVDPNPNYDDEYFSCTYDGDGNAFVDASGPDGHLVFDELTIGAKKLTRIRLGHHHHRSSDLDWDGRFLTDGDAGNTVYRFSVGADRKRVYYDGTTMLRAIGGVGTTRVVQYGGERQIVGTVSGNAVQVWQYPSGRSLRYITSGLNSPDGVAVSLAATGSRIHK